MDARDVTDRPMIARETLVGGRYEIAEELGAGGSAWVFAAHDVRLDRPVAVKVLRPALASDPGARDAFHVEASAAAGLAHPNIVAVYDVGIDDSGTGVLAWMAMERVRGHTLDDLIEHAAHLGTQTAMPPGEAISVIADVLRALSHAHENGVVHRDISPGNVMITYDGRVRVLDFGLAVVAGEAEKPDEAEAGRTGMVRGSVAYISPEQAQGLRVDARSDIYSAGCVLFALLTGAPPYLAESAAEVARLHVTAPVPVASQRRDGLPPAVDEVLARVLAKDPADRPQSAEAMRAELTRVAGELAEARTGTDQRRTNVVPVVSTTTELDAVRPRRSGVDTPVAVPVPVPGEGRRTGEYGPAASPRSAAARPAAGVPNADPEQLDQGGTWPGVLIVVVLAVVVGLVIWFFHLPASDDRPVETGGQGEEPDEPDELSPNARDQSAGGEQPDPATVPQLEGTSLSEARVILRDAGLALGDIVRRDSARPADTVLASDPAVGFPVDPGSTVTLTLASGNNTVPDVIGADLGEARAAVQNVGFNTAETEAPAGDQSLRSAGPAAVVATQPAAGTSLRLGSTVTLVIAAEGPASPEPTSEPTGTPEPDPSPTSEPDPTATPTPTGPTQTPDPPDDEPPTDDPTSDPENE